MSKPILRFKVNKQSAEVGGKYYGIVEDSAVTPENSILQICEFKKITAFAPEQVLRLVEDVCDGAAQLVARDGQSRQLSSLLKFSPRVRGTFSSEDARWSSQKLIVGARLLKDIKLDMDPSSFVMTNVADVGLLTSAAFSAIGNLHSPADSYPGVTIMVDDPIIFRLNGSKLDTWGEDNTFVKLGLVFGDEVCLTDAVTLSDFAANGFTATLSSESSDLVSLRSLFHIPASILDSQHADGYIAVIYHPDSSIEFKRLTIPWNSAE